MLAAILILAVIPFYHIPQNTILSPLSILQQLFF
jgi:hypothetical protein